MKKQITKTELKKLAAENNLTIRYDCGGCRVVQDDRDFFPDRGICPTVTRREAFNFITGYQKAGKRFDLKTIPDELAEKIGATIAREFFLKPDWEHKDCWQTEGGTFTNKGLARRAARIFLETT